MIRKMYENMLAGTCFNKLHDLVAGQKIEVDSCGHDPKYRPLLLYFKYLILIKNCSKASV